MAKKTVKFEGGEFEYDPRMALDYKNLKRIARAATDIEGLFVAFESIFEGRDEEYAEALGGSIDKMAGLLAAVQAAEGQDAKN